MIKTADDLAELAEGVNSSSYRSAYYIKYYKLDNDIDLSNFDTDADTNNGNWTPIGTSATYYFGGNFDGGDHKITGLRVTGSSASYQGLFGYVQDATIKNLGVNVDIETSGSYVGGIAGYLYYGTSIENCYVLGEIKGNQHVGGVVGAISYDASVKNCYSAGVVSGTSNVGGVLGVMYSNASGGLENCYSGAEVSGSNYVGGVLGYFTLNAGANVKNCVALNPRVAATGASFGRVAGYVYTTNAARFTNCYYLEDMNLGGKMPTATTVGTSIANKDELTYAFWTETVGWDGNSVWSFADDRYPILSSFNDPGQVDPKIAIGTQPAAETFVMAGSNTRYLSVAASVSWGADLNYQWYSSETYSTDDSTLIDGATDAEYAIPADLPAGTYYYYCVVGATGGAEDVTSDVAKVTVIDTAGEGTSESPLLISTREDMLAFVGHIENPYNDETSLCALLTTDLVFDGWTAIGTSTAPYKGVFNGNGKTLTLAREQPGASNIALFHTIAPEGAVKNLNLDVNFSGNSYIAGVAARNYGTIENVVVDGTITASIAESYAGGIAGLSGCTFDDEGEVVPGKIINCLNRADVTGVRQVGGIAGSFLGEMSRCGNEGVITGSYFFGGLLTMGLNVYSIDGASFEKRFIVSDCYNAGQVNHSGELGSFSGLLGSNGSTYLMNDWRNNDDEYEDFKVSNVFSYGEIDTGGFIISALVTGPNETPFHPSDIAQIFANTYYRDGIGDLLFYANNLNGDGTGGLGTGTVRSVIKSKTVTEFASAEMAALLNNGRTGADAPWEYVEGSPYPTLRTTAWIDEVDGENPSHPGSYSGGGGGGCNAGASILVLGLLPLVSLGRKRKSILPKD